MVWPRGVVLRVDPNGFISYSFVYTKCLKWEINTWETHLHCLIFPLQFIKYSRGQHIPIVSSLFFEVKLRFFVWLIQTEMTFESAILKDPLHICFNYSRNNPNTSTTSTSRMSLPECIYIINIYIYIYLQYIYIYISLSLFSPGSLVHATFCVCMNWSRTHFCASEAWWEASNLSHFLNWCAIANLKNFWFSRYVGWW